MKKIFLFAISFSFIVSCFLSSNFIKKSGIETCGRSSCHTGICPYTIRASEGTQENPFARKQYEWMKYRNPKTQMIPANIHTSENNYVNSLQKLYKSANAKSNYAWEYNGPHDLGGRTRAIALDYDNENIILAGGVSGGLWKTTNGGTTWYKTTAPNQIHNVSCVTQNKTSGRRNIWYYGTGEAYANTVNSAVNFPLLFKEFLGDGIFKSTNGGESWTVLPSTVSGSVNIKDDFDFVIEIETFGTDGVMAATSNGIFMSSNGGSTWNHVLGFGSSYNSSNIEITDAGIFYAAISGEGSATGIYRSTNGINWQKISDNNFPSSVYNTVIALAPSNQNLLYVLTSVKDSQQSAKLYKFDGTNWTDMSNNFYGGLASTYGGLMQVLKIKPNDPNTIFIGTIGLSRSMNGGQTYEIIGGFYRSYPDQQSIVFSRTNPNVMIIGNDGGIWKTLNNTAAVYADPNGYVGIDWISLTNNLRSTQFYTVAIDHATSGSNLIVGGMQDRGEYVTRTNNQFTPWENLLTGDGGYCAVTNGGQYFYLSMAADNRIMRFPNVPNTFDFTSVTPTNSRMGSWMSPMILDPHDQKVMYMTAGDENYQPKLWRNSDLTQIPNMWPPTPTMINWSTLDNVNFEQGSFISAFGMSPATPRRLYYARTHLWNPSANGLFKIDNPHQCQPTPQQINYPSVAEGSYLHCICVDPLDVNKITVCFTNYGVISIYHSTNGGTTWTPVAGNLEEFPDGSGNGPSVRWITVLYVQNKPIYFAATSAGLFSTTRFNGIYTAWIQEGTNTIGNVPVDMVDVRQSDGFVVIGTMGNGVYTTHVTDISTPVQVTLNATSNPANGGTITGTGTYDSGALVTLTANPNNGFRFINWTENGNIVSTNTSYTFNLNSNRNLIANFSQQHYSINLSSNPSNGGNVIGNGSFNYGSSVTVVATSANGFRFLNWTENGNVVSTSSSYSFTLIADRNLVANFELIPAISISPEFSSVSSLLGTGSFSVINTTGGNMIWDAVTNSNWLTITNGSSGTNNGIVQYRYETNTGDARIGTITITSTGSIGSPKSFEVRQAIATDVKELGIPKEFSLFQNYPNPFNPSTTIKYSIPSAEHVTLKVYDFLGKEIKTLVNEYKQPGIYNCELRFVNGESASGISVEGGNVSGVYFYQIKAGNFVETKKLILIK